MTATRRPLPSPPFRAAKVLWLPALLALSGSAMADAPSATEDCRAIPVATERLACYDALFPPKDHAVAVDEFGLSASQRLERRGEPGQIAAGQRHEARVASVRRLQRGGIEVVLDTGAVWRVTDPDPSGALRPDARVQVRPGAIGTFLMTPQGSRALRARRVR